MSARAQEIAELAQQPHTSERPGNQRHREDCRQEGIKKGKLECRRHLPRCDGIHTQWEHCSPTQGIITKWEPLDKVLPYAEHDQHRDPPGAGRPVEDREALEERQQRGRNGASGAFMTSSEPASVEIAIAPMLIQYGGDRSPARSGRRCSGRRSATSSRCRASRPTATSRARKN